MADKKIKVELDISKIEAQIQEVVTKVSNTTVKIGGGSGASQTPSSGVTGGTSQGLASTSGSQVPQAATVASVNAESQSAFTNDPSASIRIMRNAGLPDSDIRSALQNMGRFSPASIATALGGSAATVAATVSSIPPISAPVVQPGFEPTLRMSRGGGGGGGVSAPRGAVADLGYSGVPLSSILQSLHASAGSGIIMYGPPAPPMGGGPNNPTISFGNGQAMWMGTPRQHPFWNGNPNTTALPGATVYGGSSPYYGPQSPSSMPTQMMSAQQMPTQQMSAAQMPVPPWVSKVQGQWATRSAIGTGMMTAAGIAGAYAISDYLAAGAQNILTGTPSTGLGAKIAIEGIGTGLGAAIGSLTGIPFGTIAGAHIGHMLAASVGELFTAPMIRDQQNRESMTQMQGVLGMSSGRKEELVNWASGIAGAARGDFNKTIMGVPVGNTQSTFSAQAMGAILNQGAFGLLAGGFNPERMFEGGVTTTITNPLRDKMNAIADQFEESGRRSDESARSRRYIWRQSNGDFDRIAAIASRKIASDSPDTFTRTPGFTESMSQRIARRIALLYPQEDAAKSVMDTVSKVYAHTPETGGNTIDILNKFGAVATFQYMQTQSEPIARTRRSGGGLTGNDTSTEWTNYPQMTALQLSTLSANIRTTQRDERIGGLQARGSGAAVEAAARRRMEWMDKVPGGSDSEGYAESRATARDAGAVRFAQESMPFNLKASELSTQDAIAHSSPFAPGNRFRIAMDTMRLSQGRIGDLQGYMDKRRKAGDLSEQEELSVTGQINNLRVNVAQQWGALSEGVENRMPALFANAPRGLRRFDSTQLAALNTMQSGSPVRAWGSANGRHEKMQNDWLGGMDVGPASAAGFANQPNSDALIQALNRLTDAIGRSSSGNNQSSSGGLQTGVTPSWSVPTGTAN